MTDDLETPEQGLCTDGTSITGDEMISFVFGTGPRNLPLEQLARSMTYLGRPYNASQKQIKDLIARIENGESYWQSAEW